ncbi:MAG TPA: glycine betaine ABC transporter substrate-binding protein [Halanaerobiales bacterium]|nr:glycine betaine ABC transporter substrate-binding protein [Halanaerobiales bacterium]
MKKRKLLYLFTGLILLVVTLSGTYASARDEVVLTYQTWTEHYILGDIFRILLEEQTDIPLEISELESFALQLEAYKADHVDIMLGYTASMYMNVFGDTGLRDPDEIFDYVIEKSREEYDLVWLERLGFNNNYDLAVRPEVAEKYDLETYSDLAEVSENLVIAGDINFMDRPDTYPLLQEKYGMDFRDIMTVGVTLKYPTIANAQADVVNSYTTDAKIEELNLTVLEDDKHAFPSYDAAVMVRAEVLEEYPYLEEVLNRLAGKISTDEMRKMNYQVSIEHKDSEIVARDFLEEAGLI